MLRDYLILSIKMPCCGRYKPVAPGPFLVVIIWEVRHHVLVDVAEHQTAIWRSEDCQRDECDVRVRRLLARRRCYGRTPGGLVAWRNIAGARLDVCERRRRYPAVRGCAGASRRHRGGPVCGPGHGPGDVVCCEIDVLVVTCRWHRPRRRRDVLDAKWMHAGASRCQVTTIQRFTK